ncbi:MAG: DUF4301 family protein [Spirosomataceae bacterium]
MFSQQDLAQIQSRGSELAVVEEQITYFKKGFPFMQLEAAATVGHGIIRLSADDLRTYIDRYAQLSKNAVILKFVPASGAASRMFKSLFAAKEEGKVDASVEQFLHELPRFAFYQSLLKVQKTDGMAGVLAALLDEEGLDYGKMPKGLLEFHTYPDGTVRTAVEEHLVEGALYAESKGIVRLHFTVSPEHKEKFKVLIDSVLDKYELRFGVKYEIGFSVQKPSTDTIAVDENNEPFRQPDGQLLFRPAGHGALLENLAEQEADLIFIKNIDNVVPDHLKETTVQYKKALAGLVLDCQATLFAYAQKLENDAIEEALLDEIMTYLANRLGTLAPDEAKNWQKEEKRAFARAKVNRPLRACGMVQNVGEPGGGPFWAKNSDGSVSLQVVESAQVDMQNEVQKELFTKATHFNPVDLICTSKNYKNEKFDLLQFRDDETGFITEKSQSGKSLKAQELPGLWNGSMSDWNTLFVEVPLITFNPVKTVNDLLRKEHQSN